MTKFDLTGTTGQARGTGRLLVVALALALTAAGCGGSNPTDDNTTRDDSGQIIEGGEVGVNALKLGDCFNNNSDDESNQSDDVTDVLTVEAVPCSQPHDNEVYYLGALPEGDYPGADVVDQLVLDQCLTVFEAFAGISWDESQLDIARIFPSEANWDDGDHGYICVAYDVEEAKLEGSMRGRGY